ncbi:PTS sugar transporter subunit IIA [Dielma fastidiosa]|uniref:PTS sugar transporter subunit IIA n=1 Tax=Dielma fastidiosa TaxID=1034346 RepID=UPI003568CFD1
MIVSPVAGSLIPLKEVGDPVFSTGLMGEGIAVLPEDGKVYAPCDGEVIVIPPSQHAIGFRTKNGIEILIHIGTQSELIENEFKCKVKEGQRVERGDLIMTFDIQKLKAKNYDLTTPIVITNTKDFTDILTVDENKVKAGDKIIAVI